MEMEMEREAERKRERSNPFPPARSLGVGSVYGGSSTAETTRADDGVSDKMGRQTGEMGSGSGSGSKGSEVEIGVDGNENRSGRGVLTWSAVESVDVDMEETDNAASTSKGVSKSIPVTSSDMAPTTISKATNAPSVPLQRSASISSRSTTPITNPQSQTYNRKPQTPEEMALAKEKRRAAMLAAMNGSSSSTPAGLSASSSMASVSMSSLPVGAGWSVPDDPAGAGMGSSNNAGGSVTATASTSTSTSGVGAKRGLERGGTPSIAGSASGSGLMPWEPSSLT
jgi:hypothetical protein